MNLVQLEVMALGGSCGRKSEVRRMFQVSQAPLSDEQTEAHEASSIARLAVLFLPPSPLRPWIRRPEAPSTVRFRDYVLETPRM